MAEAEKGYRLLYVNGGDSLTFGKLNNDRVAFQREVTKQNGYPDGRAQRTHAAQNTGNVQLNRATANIQHKPKINVTMRTSKQRFY